MKRKPESPAIRAFRVAVRARCAGVCEARTPVCRRVVDPLFIHAHHIDGRAHNDPERDGLGVCMPCHTYIHSHPAESYEMGWMRHRNHVDGGGA